MLEFSLGAGLLFATFAGTFRYGYTFLQYNRLENAVVQGARYASLIPYDSATASPSEAFLAAVRNMTLYGSPTAGAHAAVPGLTPAQVTLTVTFVHGVPSTMTVAIQGFTVDAAFGSTTLAGKPNAAFPYHGIWSPTGS
jgi:Flp pilus assembly protein TadG